MAVLVDVQEGVEVAGRLGANRDRMRRLRHLRARGPAEDDPNEEPRAEAPDELAARGQEASAGGTAAPGPRRSGM